MEGLAMRTHRQQLDHNRYMRDRVRRLAMQREWSKAHPRYHREWYIRKSFAEIEKKKRLKELEEEIWRTTSAQAALCQTEE